MASPNENIKPRSLASSSDLVTHSARKYPRSFKVPTRLKSSSLHNIVLNDVEDDEQNPKQLPTPPYSYSGEQTRLPISPPPEEELRVMGLSAHAQLPRVFQSPSHNPLLSCPGVSKSPRLQSFVNLQRHQSQQISPDVAEFSASRSNTRKRARSIFSSIPNANSSKTLPGEANPVATPSPNPKPRKQTKVHDSRVYDGSSSKRRYTHETSQDEGNDSFMVKRQPLKKRLDSGSEACTPQRKGSTTPAASRRTTRGATPDVPYEAPAEQFTPPRSVILNVPSSATSIRSRSMKPSSKDKTRASVERKVVTVKVERFTSPFPPPPVDLSKPLPPPSPTDDPLLLTSIEDRLPRCPTPADKRILVDVAVGNGSDSDSPPSTPTRHRSPSLVHEGDQSHWNFASNRPEQTVLMDVEFDGPSSFGDTFNPEFDSDNDDNTANIDDGVFTESHVAQFNPNETAGSHIFHSDDVAAEAGEDEGEFTGRFKFYTTPVKQDPPSSATRMKRESWGRPISPFPFSRGADVPEEDEEDNDIVEHASLQSAASHSERHKKSVTPTRGGRTLSEMEAILEYKIAKRDILAKTPTDDKPDLFSAAEEPHQCSFDGNQGTVSKLFNNRNERESDDSEDSCEEEAMAVEREITPFEDCKLDNRSDAGPPPSPEVSEGTQPSLDDDDFQHGASFPARPLFTNFNTAVAKGDPGLSYVYGDEENSSDDDLPPGTVEVSSSDPRAAARAAAILKLHHAYIVDGDIAKRARRRSYHGFSRGASLTPSDAGSNSGDGIRCVQRRTLSSGGGVLQINPRQASHSPLSQTTFLPQSPAVSAIEALEEAESEIRVRSVTPMRMTTPMRAMSFQSEFATPLSVEMTSREPEKGQEPVLEWSKAHWKMLDTCFTDERLAVGEAMGMAGQMASVDDVTLDAIVARFLTENKDDATWDRQTLLRRVEALSARQRAGRGAPPSPSRKVLCANGSTPAPRTLVPPPEVEAPVKLPSTLLAPRYAHLLEEAKAMRTGGSSTTIGSATSSKTPALEDTSSCSTMQSVVPIPANTQENTDLSDLPPSTAKKVLSYLGSFLGRNDNIAPRKRTLQPSFSMALPLPPDMRQIPRGPIKTPAKKSLPKSQVPRELVHLTEVQLPSKQVEFPKTESVREMVALNHIEPPRSAPRPRAISGPLFIPGRDRHDSGSSVKELIKNFEQVSKKTEEAVKKARSRPAIKKPASVSNLAGNCPIWKP